MILPLLDDVFWAALASRKPVRYLSLCSGIEAATVAWHQFGWQPVAFSEIEPFPCAVLAYHWPHVPNLGDMTRWREWPEELLAQVDVLVGGTPCQAFSVAGLRNSLADERGNLTLIYAHLLDHLDEIRQRRGLRPVICVWENVPGVLSTKDNAFGCFLGALAGEDDALEPPGKRWTNAGLVSGPQRSITWRALDAQYFGVAQRRRRVFLVASARNDFSPEEVLFESDGVRRDSPPSREAREVAPTIPARSLGGGGLGTDFDCDGGVVKWPVEVAPTLNAHFGEKQGLEDQHAFGGGLFVPDTAHTLRGEGFDASEDGTGRGTPLVPVAFANQGNFGVLKEVSVSDPIRAKGGDTGGGGESLIAFSCKDHGGDASEIAPTLRSMGHHGSHPNGGGQVAVAFAATDYKEGKFEEVEQARPLTTTADRTRGAPITLAFKPGQSEAAGGTFVTEEFAPTLQAQNNGSTAVPAISRASAVRRLTPTECERLQGFPDNHTLIPWKKKPASACPDGPRYKALGNSMAVPCMAWIGNRIAANLP
jgi:DNA (cytosine-5)-methyltransferase 1